MAILTPMALIYAQTLSQQRSSKKFPDSFAEKSSKFAEIVMRTLTAGSQFFNFFGPPTYRLESNKWPVS
jgi:hypothetical protein